MIERILRLLFSGSPYELIDYETNRGLDHITTVGLWKEGYKFTIPDFRECFCKPEHDVTDFNPEDYFVVTTRARSIMKNYTKAKPYFYPALRNKKIIILGDRKWWPDNPFRSPKGLCIYRDLMTNLKLNHIPYKDCTIDFDKPDIALFHRDANIMKRAKAVIAFGNGGNWAFALATARRVYSLLEDTRDKNDHSLLEEKVFGDKFDNGRVMATRDAQIFSKKLNSM
jgi:hypothetical protein